MQWLRKTVHDHSKTCRGGKGGGQDKRTMLPGVNTAVVKTQDLSLTVASLMLEVRRESDKVAPVSTVVLLLQVSLQPTMGVGLRIQMYS